MASRDFAQHPGGINGRVIDTISTPHAAGDYVASAGFGTTAAVTVTAGSNDSGGEFTVTCGGTGHGASPTVTLTLKDGPYPTGANVRATCSRSGTDQPTVQFQVTTASTTTLVFTFMGTASGTEVYKCRWRV